MPNEIDSGAWLEDSSGAITPVAGTVLIGRAPICSLRLDIDAVSRRHALIHAQGREHWLVDLGSTNGVYLSNRRVRLPTPLSDGDVIDLCGHRLIFRRNAMWATQNDNMASTRRLQHTTTPAKTWLLLADIEKSSQLIQQLSPKNFAIIVGKWFLNCRDLLERCGAILHQYLGDGFFAYWPPKTESSTDVVQALQSLRELLQAGPPPFRVVLHRGMVVIDPEMTVGEDRLLGADVYFLFRMEKVASKGLWPLILSQTAAKELGSVTQITLLGQSAVTGFAGTHSFFTI